jgi:potassium efflux system protein
MLWFYTEASPILRGHVRTLVQIAQDQPSVLRQPAPGAFFVGFGEHGVMKFELRVFVGEFNRRLPTTHDINVSVAHRFRELGLSIR